MRPLPSQGACIANGRCVKTPVGGGARAGPFVDLKLGRTVNVSTVPMRLLWKVRFRGSLVLAESP